MGLTDRFQIESCGLPKQLASIPLVFDKPVYGSNELTFTDFMAPGRSQLPVFYCWLANTDTLVINNYKVE